MALWNQSIRFSFSANGRFVSIPIATYSINQDGSCYLNIFAKNKTAGGEPLYNDVILGTMTYQSLWILSTPNLVAVNPNPIAKGTIFEARVASSSATALPVRWNVAISQQ
jgi:hypothetical protein